MAMLETNPDKLETVTTEEALGLLTCFYNGIDEIVRDLAVHFATVRGSHDPSYPEAILVEKPDVVKAGEIVMSWMRQLAAEGKLKQTVLRSAEECFECSR